MSETDDTDDLLLIPPDFFILNSNLEESTEVYGPYYNVVDNLIGQVSRLENRLKYIESSNDNSGNNSIDQLILNSMSNNSEYDVRTNFSSTHSTPQKPKVKLKLNSLPSTPSTLEYLRSPNGSQTTLPSFRNEYIRNKRDSPSRSIKTNLGFERTQKVMLSEIDNFITNVKTLKKYDVSRNLANQFDTSVPLDRHEDRQFKNRGDCLNNRLNINDINELIRSVESRQKENETNITHNNINENVLRSEYQEDESTNYHKGNYDTATVQKYKSKSQFQDFTSVSSERRESRESVDSNVSSPDSSSETQRTVFNQNSAHNTNYDVYSNPSGTLNKRTISQHSNDFNQGDNRLLDTRNQPVGNDQSTNVSTSSSSPVKDKLALINLAKLWNKKERHTFEQSVDFNHFQEEKLRRQHCEQLIQKLQIQSLEFQEKLAVALEVDRAKDKAIMLIHNSWLEAVQKIDVLIKDKSNQEEQQNQLRTQVSHEITEANKRADQYAQESSKALNLAHANQEKLESLRKQNESLLNELKSYQQKLGETQKDRQNEVDNNEELARIISSKDAEISKGQIVLMEARNEVSQSKKAIEGCHSELNAMKDRCSKLEYQINLQFENTKKLEMEKTKHLQSIEELKITEKNLQDNLNHQKSINEQTKVELRNFYQSQAETVIQDKFREFQSQLDRAENAIQEKIRSCEFSVAKTAAVHIQQLVHKHELEIELLEEKHKEEIKLLELQSSQLQKQVANLHLKIEQLQERKSIIAQQLHRVMESQWLEVLKILNTDKTPIVSRDKSTNTMDQLNNLKSKSFTNVEEIFKDDFNTNKGRDLKAVESSTSTLNSSTDKLEAFGDNKFNNQNYEETPVSSRSEKHRQQTENELQKYIQILLNSPCTNNVNNTKLPGKQKTPSTSNQLPDEPLSWQSVNQNDELQNYNKQQKNGNRDRTGKRPWK